MHHLSSRYIPCDGRLTASAYFNPHSPQGERRPLRLLRRDLIYFNPRSPQGERLSPPPPVPVQNCYFNPRSPHGERLRYSPSINPPIPFQSTLPAWGATSLMPSYVDVNNFNPRSPHGERRLRDEIVRRCTRFQSTLPAWGATM